ncbi:hypothetical protein D3P09_14705 [Paenibacillus pinisoli]|uniref:Uncharacterized protein n=1 Tax=Paenibacillus pinisoli TaxID=1276110 RepID=A0A3A6PBV8_9BACL|nr:hypothetical protein [Paenibacillus pinisoli]RJX38782.1 hypothetical protein D3P09_14705 [Paenibacillus pinisoli]
MTAKRKHPVLIVSNSLWSGYRASLIGYWMIFVVVFVGINLFLPNNLSDQMETQGIWAGAGFSPKVYLLVIGILLTPVSMTSYVSNGITRKHFVGGTILLSIPMALISAVVMTLGFPVEQLLRDWVGGKEIMANPSLLQSGVEFFLGFLAYYVVGWMIGSGFYRYNWKAGVVISILSLLPLILIEAVGSNGTMELFGSAIAWPEIPFIVEMLLILFIVAIIMAINYAMLRKAAIKRKLI